MRIYLAAPYSHADPAVRQARFAVVNRVAGELLAMGFEVFSPITMGHVVCEACGLPTGFSFWRKNCLSFLDGWATHLLVLKLEGWEESEGVSEEYAVANALGLGVLSRNVDELLGSKTVSSATGLLHWQEGIFVN